MKKESFDIKINHAPEKVKKLLTGKHPVPDGAVLIPHTGPLKTHTLFNLVIAFIFLFLSILFFLDSVKGQLPIMALVMLGLSLFFILLIFIRLKIFGNQLKIGTWKQGLFLTDDAVVYRILPKRCEIYPRETINNLTFEKASKGSGRSGESKIIKMTIYLEDSSYEKEIYFYKLRLPMALRKQENEYKLTAVLKSWVEDNMTASGKIISG